MTLLEALKKIRDEGPLRLDAGICCNVIELAYDEEKEKIVGFELKELDDLMAKWPDNKGEGLPCKICYPVEGNSEQYEADALMNKIWDNPRRIELLNWLIKELENDITRSTEKDS